MLFSMMTISAQAQWFDFSENIGRAVVGVNTGIVGYHGIPDIANASTWNLSDIGVGISAAIAGFYADFVYVNPDHRFDSHLVNYDWEDHSAWTFNAGYQIPIYKDYVFITPLIGISIATVGYTEGNNFSVDSESNSIYHKYHIEDWYPYFNYGGGLTVVPCKWFEINVTCTAHAAYAGVAFNIMNYQD